MSAGPLFSCRVNSYAPSCFLSFFMVHLPRQRRLRSNLPPGSIHTKAISMAEPGIASASNTGNPPGGFFDRVNQVVGNGIFSKYSFIRRFDGVSRLAILDGHDVPLNEREVFDFYQLKPDELRNLSIRSQGHPIVILVENINRDCVELLDAAFGIDPVFLSAYEHGVAASQDALPNDFRDLANRLREADGSSLYHGAVWTIRVRGLPTNRTTFRHPGTVSHSAYNELVAVCSWPASQTRKSMLLTVLLPETHIILYDRPCCSRVWRSLGRWTRH